MQCTLTRLSAMSLTFCLTLFASSTFAAPYEWTIDRIQDLDDVTPSFHGGAGQLSTINSITPIADGVELDVTFRIGQETDAGAPNYGLSFARVSLQGLLGAPGLDLGTFTSSSFKLTTSTSLTVQSFVMTDFTEDGVTIDDGDGIPNESLSMVFWEHIDPAAVGGPTNIDFDFAAGTEFDNDWNLLNPQQVQGTDAVRAWGMQLAKFSGMTVGAPVNATIRIEGVVPEPSSVILAGLAALAALAASRRRRSRTKSA